MSEIKVPGWLRALAVILGLVAVLLSSVVLIFPDLAVLTLILVLSFALLVIGIARICVGIFAKYLSDGIRAFNGIVGLLTIMLGIVVMAIPGIGTAMLITLLAIGILFNGIARVVIGGVAKVFPNWLRGALIVVGLLVIVFSAAVLIFPKLAVLTLVFLVAISFLLNGLARIIAGIRGT